MSSCVSDLDIRYMKTVENLTQFDEQFSNRSTIALDLGGQAMASVIDVDPGIFKPQENADIPILIAPGFLVSPDRLKDPVRELWLADRRVIAVQHPKHIVHGLENNIINKGNIVATKLNRIELNRAASLLKAIDEKAVDQVDVIGISEGGINATFLALLRPDRVRTLTLINSAGIGGESFSHLVSFFMQRTIKELAETTINPKRKEALASRAPLLHYASNPLSRLRSLRAMSQCRIDTLFETIENSGVAVGILKTSTDAIYPEKIERPYIDTNIVSSYKVLDHPKSGHSPLYSLPQQTVELVLNMQKDMLA